MKVFACIAATATLLAFAAPASAQFAKPEDAIKYRQSSLSVMATHYGRIGAMVNGRVPFDAKLAAENAEIVSSMSKLPWAAFGPGTDKMVAETTKLAAAAKTGNADTLKAAFGATGASCKACHDNYQAKL